MPARASREAGEIPAWTRRCDRGQRPHEATVSSLTGRRGRRVIRKPEDLSPGALTTLCVVNGAAAARAAARKRGARARRSVGPGVVVFATERRRHAARRHAGGPRARGGRLRGHRAAGARARTGRSPHPGERHRPLPHRPQDHPPRPPRPRAAARARRGGRGRGRGAGAGGAAGRRPAASRRRRRPRVRVPRRVVRRVPQLPARRREPVPRDAHHGLPPRRRLRRVRRGAAAEPDPRARTASATRRRCSPSR